MAKNIITEQIVVTNLPIAHQGVLGNLVEMCVGMPMETEETGVTWKKGYKFFELYLAADRFDIPNDNWLLINKK
jgi:predicted methyltransferase MtxX (methanogen marker protein 4)